MLLQVLIIITGNYNFFNLLTLVLTTALLDDRHLAAEPGLGHHKKIPTCECQHAQEPAILTPLSSQGVSFPPVPLSNPALTPPWSLLWTLSPPVDCPARSLAQGPADRKSVV